MDEQWAWVVVLVAAASAFALQGLSRAVCGGLECYKALDAKHRMDWDTRVVGIAHAVIQAIGCSRVLLALEPTLSVDFTGHSVASQLQISIALGFFTWDLCVCVRLADGAGVAHAAACILVYLLCFVPEPFIQYSGCFFLLFELSTPFLHVRMILIMAGKTDTLLFKVCHYTFPLTFLVVRILAGVPVSIFWFREMIALVAENTTGTPTAVAVCYMGLNVLLNGLNIFWFSIIVRKALGAGKPASGEKKKA